MLPAYQSSWRSRCCSSRTFSPCHPSQQRGRTGLGRGRLGLRRDREVALGFGVAVVMVGLAAGAMVEVPSSDGPAPCPPVATSSQPDNGVTVTATAVTTTVAPRSRPSRLRRVTFAQSGRVPSCSCSAAVSWTGGFMDLQQVASRGAYLRTSTGDEDGRRRPMGADGRVRCGQGGGWLIAPSSPSGILTGGVPVLRDDC